MQTVSKNFWLESVALFATTMPAAGAKMPILFAPRGPGFENQKNVLQKQQVHSRFLPMLEYKSPTAPRSNKDIRRIARYGRLFGVSVARYAGKTLRRALRSAIETLGESLPI